MIIIFHTFHYFFLELFLNELISLRENLHLYVNLRTCMPFINDTNLIYIFENLKLCTKELKYVMVKIGNENICSKVQDNLWGRQYHLGEETSLGEEKLNSHLLNSD